jgi:hypothetical protein
MKKFILFALVIGLAIVALRSLGPTLGKRAMAKCQELMARHEGQPGDRPCDELTDEPMDLAGTLA